MIAVFAALVGCAGAPPDLDLTGPPHARPPRVAVRCVAVTVEDVQIRGVSSPSVIETNTRMRGRTSDGRTVGWDYSRALLPGPPLAPGDGLMLQVADDGGPVAVTRTCPAGLPVSP